MRNISYDIAAIFLLILLLFSVVFRKATTGRANKMFLASIFICLISTIFDVAATILDANGREFVAMVKMTHAAYLALHTMQSLIYLYFVIGLLDLWHKLEDKKYLNIALAAPYVIIFVLTVTSPFTNLIFSADNGVYIHGPLFNLLYICVVIYIVLTGIIVLVNRRLLTTAKIYRAAFNGGFVPCCRGFAHYLFTAASGMLRHRSEPFCFKYNGSASRGAS